ncbi:MAG: hypothetical protein NTV00_11280 [Methylococcales bacterium]|nr:hypothetical protein [Methylococcales bacterium]
MNHKKLLENIDTLRQRIKRKSEINIPYFTIAHKFADNFEKYTRTSTVNLISSFNEALFHYDWPFPAYILEFTGRKWRRFIVYFVLALILIRYKLKDFIFKPKPSVFEHRFEEFLNEYMLANFRVNSDYIFCEWRVNPIFEGKHYLINNISKCYKNELWYACIVAAFPLLDYLCRKYFNSTNLTTSINKINNLFKKAGITSADVKPGYMAWEASKNTGESSEDVVLRDLRLIGVGLGSFLEFAEKYYEHSTDDNYTSKLNRHAILHCANVSPELWSRENTVKLLLFIDLALRLEVPLRILLNETN